MFWEIVLSIGTVLLTVFFYALKENGTFSNNGDAQKGTQNPKIQKRLVNFADFFKLLTHEKTASHIGGPEMKALRAMLCHRTLDEISPAVLRGWSRALRDRAGTFSKIKIETAQLQENVQQPKKDGEDEEKKKAEPIFNEFCQLIAEVEFEPLEKKDKYDFRSSGSSLSSMASTPSVSPKNSGGAKNVVSSSSTTEDGSLTTETKKQKEPPVVCPCLIRFRTDPKHRILDPNAESENNNNKDDSSIRESVVGFHVLPPKSLKDENGKQLPFDIMSYIDPFEIDQFAEGAVEALFDDKFAKDPFEGFWKYCVKPLQNLYDTTKLQKEKENNTKDTADDNKKETTTSSTNSLLGALPPKQRREKLMNDMKKLKTEMGFYNKNDPEVQRFSPTVTMNNAELDEKTYPNAKSICARVTHTGPDRDCILTLHVLLDGDSPFGIGVVKYSFGMTAPKKKTMLFDQDTQNPLGTF